MRTLLLGLAALACAAGPARGATLGIFADSTCTTCDVQLPPGGSTRAYVRLVTEGLEYPITGAEFRITGLPSGWVAVSVPNPAASLVLGNPFASGANIAFPTAQSGACIDLYTVTLVAPTAVSDVVLRVEAHATPSNPQLACPAVPLACGGACDIAACVGGGRLHVNASVSCTVGVTAGTWASIKRLYASPR